MAHKSLHSTYQCCRNIKFNYATPFTIEGGFANKFNISYAWKNFERDFWNTQYIQHYESVPTMRLYLIPIAEYGRTVCQENSLQGDETTLL